MAGTQLSAEARRDGPQRTVLVAELLGHVLQGPSFRKDRAKRLILLLVGLGRFEEEAAAQGLVHDLGLRNVNGFPS